MRPKCSLSLNSQLFSPAVDVFLLSPPYQINSTVVPLSAISNSHVKQSFQISPKGALRYRGRRGEPLTRNTLKYRTDSSSNSCSLNDSRIWAASFSQDLNLLRRLGYEDFPRCHVTATTKKIAGKNVPSVFHHT